MHAKLTKRQSEIMNLCMEGLSYKEIGNILKLQTKTVKFHMYNIMRQIGINSKSKLIVNYYKSKLQEQTQ